VLSHSCYGEDATTRPEERHPIFHIKRDTTSGSNRIRRANLDGTGAQDVLSASDPVALALDSQSGRLFWDEFGTPPRTIYSANTDGSGKLQLVLDPGSPYDIALHTPVPEPSTLLLLASGVAGLAGTAWRKCRRR
jgi:hypothetical protein